MTNFKVKISPIKEMEIRCSRIQGAISLAQGVPDFDTPLCIKNKAIQAITEGKATCYSLSPGLVELREAIEYNLSKKGIFYDFENEIIVTAGSIEAITASLLALCSEGDEVLISDPAYTSYQEAILLAREKPVFFPLKADDNWRFDFDELKKRITNRTRALILCNPNNPTGVIFSRTDLMKLVELAEYHDFYILSDEVYRDFVYDGKELFSLGQLSAFRKRLVFIFSFSKAYAMTGWRVGYLATDESLAKKIIASHDAMVTCAPVASQWGALAALEMAQNDINYFRDSYEKRRDTICSLFETLKDWFSFVRPDSAYYFFPKITKNFEKTFVEKRMKIIKSQPYYAELRADQQQSISWLLALDLLDTQKLALVPGIAFGSQGEKHLRLCFGRRESDIEQGVIRIKRYIENFLG